MDFKYDDEQDALREAVRGLVGKAYGDYENRRRATKDDPGFDEKQWAQDGRDGPARACRSPRTTAASGPDRSRSASCARSSAG